jgi:hypothetical protein
MNQRDEADVRLVADQVERVEWCRSFRRSKPVLPRQDLAREGMCR